MKGTTIGEHILCRVDNLLKKKALPSNTLSPCSDACKKLSPWRGGGNGDKFII